METTPIHANYHGIETASYLLLSKNEAILIDTGSAVNAKEFINPRLRELTRNRDIIISTIVNTHSHADHSGGNYFLRSTWHSQILAHEAESEYISDRRKALQEYFTTENPHPRPSKWEVAQLKRDFGASARVTKRLKDGFEIQFGLSALKVLHTPGHSQGSISLYEPEGRVLFLGDTVQGVGVEANFPTLPIYDNVEDYEKSLMTLRDVDIATAYLGHPFLPVGSTQLNRREFSRFLDSSLAALENLGARVQELSRHGRDASAISRIIMREYGWVQSKRVQIPVLVQKSVEACLRSRRWTQ